MKTKCTNKLITYLIIFCFIYSNCVYAYLSPSNKSTLSASSKIDELGDLVTANGQDDIGEYFSILKQEEINPQIERIVKDKNGRFRVIRKGKRNKGWYDQNKDHDRSVTGSLQEADQYTGWIQQAMDVLIAEHADLAQYDVWVLEGVNFSGHYGQTHKRVYIPIEILEIVNKCREDGILWNITETNVQPLWRLVLEDFIEHEYLHTQGYDEGRITDISNEKRPRVYRKAQRMYGRYISEKLIEAVTAIAGNGTDESEAANELKNTLEYLRVSESIRFGTELHRYLWLLDRSKDLNLTQKILPLLNHYLHTQYSGNTVYLAAELYILEYLNSERQVDGSGDLGRISSVNTAKAVIDEIYASQIERFIKKEDTTNFDIHKLYKSLNSNVIEIREVLNVGDIFIYLSEDEQRIEITSLDTGFTFCIFDSRTLSIDTDSPSGYSPITDTNFVLYKYDYDEIPTARREDETIAGPFAEQDRIRKDFMWRLSDFGILSKFVKDDEMISKYVLEWKDVRAMHEAGEGRSKKRYEGPRHMSLLEHIKVAFKRFCEDEDEFGEDDKSKEAEFKDAQEFQKVLRKYRLGDEQFSSMELFIFKIALLFHDLGEIKALKDSGGYSEEAYRCHPIYSVQMAESMFSKWDHPFSVREEKLILALIKYHSIAADFARYGESRIKKGPDTEEYVDLFEFLEEIRPFGKQGVKLLWRLQLTDAGSVRHYFQNSLANGLEDEIWRINKLLTSIMNFKERDPRTEEPKAELIDKLRKIKLENKKIDKAKEKLDRTLIKYGVRFTEEQQGKYDEAYKIMYRVHLRRHRKDKRKTPEATHPLETTEILVREFKVTNVNWIIASLLHDVIEDSRATLDAIEQNEVFGPEDGREIRQMVDLLSKPNENKFKGKNRDEKKRNRNSAYFHRLVDGDKEITDPEILEAAQVIKFADRVHSLDHLDTEHGGFAEGMIDNTFNEFLPQFLWKAAIHHKHKKILVKRLMSQGKTRGFLTEDQLSGLRMLLEAIKNLEIPQVGEGEEPIEFINGVVNDTMEQQGQFNRPVVLAFDGMSGCGRTMLTKNLETHMSKGDDVNKKHVVKIDLTDFLIPRSDRDADLDEAVGSKVPFARQREEHYRFNKFRIEVLDRIREFQDDPSRESLELSLSELYDRSTGEINPGASETPIEIKRDSVIIIEGMHILQEEFLEYYDSTFVIFATYDQCLKNILKREREKTIDEQQDVGKIMKRYEFVDKPSYSRHWIEYWLKCDYVIFNTDFDNPLLRPNLLKRAEGDSSARETYYPEEESLEGINNRNERIAYMVPGKEDTLYLNLTNGCINNCNFCFRNFPMVFPIDLDLEGKEPEMEEIIRAIEYREDLSCYKEIVFCGLGEPLLRPDEVIEAAKWIKSHYPDIKIRINTIGQVNLTYKSRRIANELKGLIDSISISLNAEDSSKYQQLCHPKHEEKAYPAIIEFAEECRDNGIDVILSVVTGYPSLIGPAPDVEKCRQIAKNLGVNFIERSFNERSVIKAEIRRFLKQRQKRDIGSDVEYRNIFERNIVEVTAELHTLITSEEIQDMSRVMRSIEATARSDLSDLNMEPLYMLLCQISALDLLDEIEVCAMGETSKHVILSMIVLESMAWGDLDFFVQRFVNATNRTIEHIAEMKGFMDELTNDPEAFSAFALGFLLHDYGLLLMKSGVDDHAKDGSELIKSFLNELDLTPRQKGIVRAVISEHVKFPMMLAGEITPINFGYSLKKLEGCGIKTDMALKMYSLLFFLDISAGTVEYLQGREWLNDEYIKRMLKFAEKDEYDMLKESYVKRRFLLLAKTEDTLDKAGSEIDELFDSSLGEEVKEVYDEIQEEEEDRKLFAHYVERLRFNLPHKARGLNGKESPGILKQLITREKGIDNPNMFKLFYILALACRANEIDGTDIEVRFIVDKNSAIALNGILDILSIDEIKAMFERGYYPFDIAINGRSLAINLKKERLLRTKQLMRIYRTKISSLIVHTNKTTANSVFPEDKAREDVKEALEQCIEESSESRLRKSFAHHVLSEITEPEEAGGRVIYSLNTVTDSITKNGNRKKKLQELERMVVINKDKIFFYCREKDYELPEDMNFLSDYIVYDTDEIRDDIGKDDKATVFMLNTEDMKSFGFDVIESRQLFSVHNDYFIVPLTKERDIDSDIFLGLEMLRNSDRMNRLHPLFKLLLIDTIREWLIANGKSSEWKDIILILNIEIPGPDINLVDDIEESYRYIEEIISSA